MILFIYFLQQWWFLKAVKIPYQTAKVFRVNIKPSVIIIISDYSKLPAAVK